MFFDTCIRRYGRVFCWDSENQTVVDVTPKVLAAEQCPKDVLFDLLRLAGTNGKARGSEEEVCRS